MKSIGGTLFLFGIASVVFNFMDREVMLLGWIGMWGEAVAWAIRAALVIGGGVLWLLGKKSEEGMKAGIIFVFLFISLIHYAQGVNFTEEEREFWKSFPAAFEKDCLAMSGGSNVVETEDGSDIVFGYTLTNSLIERLETLPSVIELNRKNDRSFLLAKIAFMKTSYNNLHWNLMVYPICRYFLGDTFGVEGYRGHDRGILLEAALRHSYSEKDLTERLQDPRWRDAVLYAVRRR